MPTAIDETPQVIPAKTPLKVWNFLTRCLPVVDKDADFWWRLTGYHMAVMIEAAGYTPERQYEVLLFHHHFIVSNNPLLDLVKVRCWTLIVI